MQNILVIKTILWNNDKFNFFLAWKWEGSMLLCCFVFTYLALHDICWRVPTMRWLHFPKLFNESLKGNLFVTYLLKVANNDQTTNNRNVWFMYNPTYMSSWPFIVYSTWKYIWSCKHFKVTIHLILNKLLCKHCIQITSLHVMFAREF